MMLTLHIDYRTAWGESLRVCGSAQALGAGRDNFAAPMTPDSEGCRWTLNIDIPDAEMPLEYSYIVVRDGRTVRREWGKPRTLGCRSVHSMNVYDHWCDMPADKPMYASAFTRAVFARPAQPAGTAPEPEAGRVFFELEAPVVAPDCVVAVCGSTPSLGSWNPARAVRLDGRDYPLWRGSVDARELTAATEYKFIVLNPATGDVAGWEYGENRVLGVDPAIGEATVLAGLRMRDPFRPWHGAGVAIPVFALRSDDDFGVGDFYDLKAMVDWAAATGQSFVQILPVNDTTMTHTWMDSYPYNANSTFALHPMYLRLQELGTLADKSRREYFATLARELNALEQIDYERVNSAKIEYFREMFAQEGAATIASDSYKAFFEANRDWLVPYAAFCVLRDRYQTPDFSQWPEHAVYDAEAVRAFAAANSAEIDYVCYLQYHLDKQMRHVAAYARSRGIAIKGDIPIGISRTSADAWQSPELFNMDCQAGAPPDDFSVLGQNWGFPTYNWDVMARDGYAWWKARFRKMSQYFDAYRIDHVLGFFRIWQIPMDAVHGLLGIFSPALPFAPDELSRNYDFRINPDLHTRPYIMDWFLGDFFGDLTDTARAHYLKAEGYGRYSLLPEFDTQRKVADHFAALPPTADNCRLRDALMGLIDNVLFIEDPVERGKYHPRISAQQTYIYRSLNDYERWCFNRLYDDFFYHRHDAFWEHKAMEKLPPLIQATDMLVCAEDLGMIPHCVPAVMDRLRILALEIQRMPKDPATEFGHTDRYPYLSVCTTSTHDMGGIRQWWEEDRAATQRFYNTMLRHDGEAPYYAEPWICREIIEQHLNSPSMLCILPLQDWLSIDGDLRRTDPREEQINVPANSRHYWRYRMHLTVEALQRADSFNDILRNAIARSGR
ncbi:MAG: 4-alpha-glucanotransferase [Muribaculaceae bacterium]|nr:4-alpha-glucanotransferase [Muribaculaceae bacterium]